MNAFHIVVRKHTSRHRHRLSDSQDVVGRAIVEDGHAAKAVGLPPASTSSAHVQNAGIPVQGTDFHVNADDKEIPSDPQESPDDVGNDISWPVVVRSEEAEDDENDLEEVGQDGRPHVSQEVEDLALECCDQLNDANRQDQDPRAAARHALQTVVARCLTIHTHKNVDTQRTTIVV